jgi:hypothetical protein
MSSSGPNIADIRAQLEKNIESAQSAQIEIERETELTASLEAAQKKYQKNKKAWQAHVRFKRAVKVSKFVASKVIDHLTVIGSVVIEAPGLYSTGQHIENLQTLDGWYRCSCGEKSSGSSSSSSITSLSDSSTPKEHCKSAILPYVLLQKKRKLDHKTIALVPGAGAAQSIGDAVHATKKAVDGDLHTIRDQMAKELMAACKGKCLLGNAIAAELLGSYSSVDAQTKLEAYKSDGEGWRYLAEKMLPTG